jgi:biopolymer transport protein ExbD
MRERGARRTRLARVPMVAGFNVTSMMDMFTIILVFLLNFLDPSTEVTGELSLPAARTEQVVDRGVRLTVTKERVLVEGQEVLQLDAGALPAGVARLGRRIDPVFERLAAAAAALPKAPGSSEQDASNAVLLVQCDRAVPFSVLGELLYTAGQAGYGQFRFVVISQPG